MRVLCAHSGSDRVVWDWPAKAETLMPIGANTGWCHTSSPLQQTISSTVVDVLLPVGVSGALRTAGPESAGGSSGMKTQSSTRRSDCFSTDELSTAEKARLSTPVPRLRILLMEERRGEGVVMQFMVVVRLGATVKNGQSAHYLSLA